MRKVLIISGIFIALFVLFVPAVAVGATARPERPIYVIIVTIDGCRPDSLLEASTPNIDEIVQDAAYSWSAQTVYPSKTPQAHASLFTGALPGVHRYTGPGSRLETETIFQVFEGAGYKTALVDGKGGRIAGLEVGVSYVKNNVDYRWRNGAVYQPGYEDPNGDIRVMENAIQIFVENQPTLMFILLPVVDVTGHIYSHTSHNYLQAIERADQAIGMLVDNLKGLGIYENTLLVIVSDHGMTGTDHGSQDPGDMSILLIFSGPGVRVGKFEGGKIIDVAPTVTALFGLRAPANAEGRNLFAEEPIPLFYVGIAMAAVMVCVAYVLVRRRRAREVPQPASAAVEASG